MLLALVALGIAPPSDARSKKGRAKPKAAAPTIADAPLPPEVAATTDAVAAAARAGRWAEALDGVARLRTLDPPLAAANGYDYLEARAQAELGRFDPALSGFAAIVAAGGPLAPAARRELAWTSWTAGRPDGADALLQRAEAGEGDAEEAARAVTEHFERADPARLLAAAERLENRGPVSMRREMRLHRAIALVRLGREGEAAPLLLALAVGDPARVDSYAALQQLDRLGRGLAFDGHPPDTRRRLAETALAHRDFERAIPALDRSLPPGGDREYRVGRALEQAERHDAAVVRYEAALALEPVGPRRDLVLYRLAQTKVLGGRPAEAITAFHRLLDEASSPAARQRAHLSLLRLEVETGRLDEAVAHFTSLRIAPVPSKGRRGSKSPPLSSATASTVEEARVLVGAALLEAGRIEAAASLLEGGPPDVAASTILRYWRGRLAEAQGRPEEAAARLAAAAAWAGEDPVGLAARERIGRLPSEARLAVRGTRLAATAAPAAGGRALLDGRELLALSLGDAETAEAVEVLRLIGRATPSTAPWVDLVPAPLPRPLPAGHPSAGSDATRMLLALGLTGDAGPDLSRYLPLSRPATALAAALAHLDGGDWSRGLYAASVIRGRVDELPFEALPASLQRALYPEAYPAEVASGSVASRVEAELIRAVIREESHFRPASRSGAAARGLMQFVIATAHDVAGRLGLGEIQPDDLYRPDLSVALGARYLADLLETFGGEAGPAVAAYNAGTPAAKAWRRSAGSGEVEKFLAAVAYPETRAYVRRVVGSWARYRQLAGRPGPFRVAALPEAPFLPPVAGAPR